MRMAREELSVPGGARWPQAALAAAPALAEMRAEELAKLAPNPVGNPVSVPFQSDTNFNVGDAS